MSSTLPALLLVLSGPALAQSSGIHLLSTGPSGGSGNGNSSAASFSSTGRYVGFWSFASDLVPGDLNQSGDVFVRDRRTGSTRRASISSLGTEQHWSTTPVHVGSLPEVRVSEDGNVIAFASLASDLVPGDTNQAYDVFVHDFASASTTRVSVSSSGAQSGSHSGVVHRIQFTGGPGGYQIVDGRGMLDMTPDGRFVAFTSMSPDLAPNDGDPWSDVYVHDRSTGTTELLSVNTLGYDCYGMSISDDGRFAAVELGWMVVVFDRQSSTQEIVSVSITGAVGNAPSGAYLQYPPPGCSHCNPIYIDQGSDISADGRWVAFGSMASDLVQADSNGARDVFLHDRWSGTTTLVSVGFQGASANGPSGFPRLSAEGRYVAFVSTGSDIDPLDTSSNSDFFVRDMLLGTTRCVSLDPNVPPPAWAHGVQSGDLAHDGHQVTFTTDAALVPQDSPPVTPGVSYDDVYARGAPVVSFMAGCDAAGSVCPCGGGAVAAGCPNSFHPGGARLTATGEPSVSADTLALVASDLPSSSVVAFLQSQAAMAPTAFGDGVECLSGATIRLGVRSAMTGTALFGSSSDPRISVAGLIPLVGGSRHYQTHYRDLPSYCTSASFNATNSIRVDWTH